MKKLWISFVLFGSLAVVSQSFAVFKGKWVKSRMQELTEKLEDLRERCPKDRATKRRIKKIEDIVNEVKESAKSAEVEA